MDERAPSGDDELYERCVADLADAVEAAIGPWVERSVHRVAEAWRPGAWAGLAADARRAGEAATDEVGARVRALLALDVDEQPTGPLAIIRSAVAHPTAVLAAAGVPSVARDDFARSNFPDDPYDLTPASFRDVGEDVHEPGIRWGAAKAHRVLTRRRAEGRR